MEDETPSFRDILMGAAGSEEEQEEEHSENESFFVGPEHPAYHSEQARREGQYLASQGEHPIQRMDHGHPFANPNTPNYSASASATASWPPTQPMESQRPQRHSEGTLSHEANHNINVSKQRTYVDMTWNSWQSRDFLSDMFASNRNERLFNLQVQGCAGPSHNQPNANSGLTWPEPSFNQLYADASSALPYKGPKMKLVIFPSQPVNIVGNNLHLRIQVFNVPDNLSLTSSMFEAVAVGPTGKRFPCHIRKGASPEPNTFEAFVRSVCETGCYELQARMSVLPQFWNNQNIETGGIVSEVTRISVSKNYYHNSRDCYSFQGDGRPHFNESEDLYSKVWGLTCNKWQNHIYYCDRESNKIHCVDPEGRLIYSFGTSTGPGGLNRPCGITFDHDLRRLIVADKDNHRIILFTPDGQYISSFGQGQSHEDLHYPWDVAINPINENIAVTDSGNARVQLFDRWGNFITRYSFNKKAQLRNNDQAGFPTACCFDDDGRSLFVTDFNLHNVLKFNSDLSYCTKVVDRKVLRRPQGIVSDPHANLLVADSKNNCVRILSDEGHLVSGVYEVSSQPLIYPVNLTLLAGGEKLVVLDGLAKLHIF
ncbi:unnamed protein product [Orchesella dallaii]|uniref:SMP-30/Gluconolactonase/LRE-like region domain-containing protein n=1 Tax=Orchesella dallaii TaxID=48710 RepID=A0ABP1QIP3_9HEXA